MIFGGSLNKVQQDIQRNILGGCPSVAACIWNTMQEKKNSQLTLFSIKLVSFSQTGLELVK